MNQQDQPNDLPAVQPDPAAQPTPSSDKVVSSPPLSQATAPPKPADTGKVTEITLPAEAQDSDLIEKEWVEKAKDIVEHTRDNPHEQQKAINQMKAEYMKKRYNRDTKVGE